MSSVSVRALERTDLPPAAALFEQMLGSGTPRADPALVEFLERTLFDNPWSDPELPSLVAVDAEARIVGFLAAGVRRMLLGSRPVRLVVCSHFVVDPAAQRRAVGALLLRRMLDGVQDATISDSASDLVRRMWTRLGGDTLSLRSVHWVRVFRPWQVMAHVAGQRLSRPRLRRPLLPAADILDRVSAHTVDSLLEPARPSGTEEPLTSHALMRHLPSVGARVALRPDYDEQYADWLLGQLGQSERRGRPVAHLVRTPDQRAAGWYVYFLRPGWRSEVMAITAGTERDVDLVLEHLFWHAYRNGSAALRGRVEPHILEPLVRRRCLLWYGWASLIHSKNADLVRAVQSGSAVLTRLEGEWWGDALI